MIEQLNNKIINKDIFSKKVEDFVRHNGVETMEAVIHIAETLNIEIESIKGFLNKDIIKRIEVESKEKNLLKREDNVLPI